MSRMMDADKFLSWLSEVEGEIRKEKMKDCQPDRYDDGLMAATGTVREYVEKMCKIDEAEGKANQSWIPCSERMPKGTVLCCDDRGNMLVGLLCENEVGYTAYDDDGQAMYNCVAWMPLPEPYRERE